jgi:hypothetical protein
MHFDETRGRGRAVSLNDDESRRRRGRLLFQHDFQTGGRRAMHLDWRRRWRFTFDDRHALVTVGAIFDHTAGKRAQGCTKKTDLSDRGNKAERTRFEEHAPFRRLMKDPVSFQDDFCVSTHFVRTSFLLIHPELQLSGAKPKKKQLAGILLAIRDLTFVHPLGGTVGAVNAPRDRNLKKPHEKIHKYDDCLRRDGRAVHRRSGCSR